MDHQKVYDRLIESAKTRNLDGRKENHHIFPSHLGGDDYPENLVKLSLREHYLAHLLLAKMYPKTGMVNAAFMMSGYKRFGKRVNSRMYAWLKENRIYTPFTEEHCENISKAAKTRKYTEEGRKKRAEKWAERNRQNSGTSLSESHRENIGNSLRGNNSKTRRIKLGILKEFSVTCFWCGANSTTIEREPLFPKSLRYFCSRTCSKAFTKSRMQEGKKIAALKRASSQNLLQ